MFLKITNETEPRKSDKRFTLDLFENERINSGIYDVMGIFALMVQAIIYVPRCDDNTVFIADEEALAEMRDEAHTNLPHAKRDVAEAARLGAGGAPLTEQEEQMVDAAFSASKEFKDGKIPTFRNIRIKLRIRSTIPRGKISYSDIP